MKIWSHSGIDGNGQEFITVELEPATTQDDRSGLFGGRYVSFCNNHAKQTTDAWLMHWDGGPRYDKELRVWRGETLDKKECLAFCAEVFQ